MHQHTETEEPVHRIPKCELSPDDELVEFTNFLQQILWKRTKQSKATARQQSLSFIEWINLYSPCVREFYDTHVESGFFVGWHESDDLCAMEKTIRTIEECIYQ